MKFEYVCQILLSETDLRKFSPKETNKGYHIISNNCEISALGKLGLPNMFKIKNYIEFSEEDEKNGSVTIFRTVIEGGLPLKLNIRKVVALCGVVRT